MKIFATIFIGINVFCVSVTSAHDLVSVGVQKQLLVDDYVIDQKQNITLELGKPIKKGVVMASGLPTEPHSIGLPKSGDPFLGARTTVIWNEQQKKIK